MKNLNERTIIENRQDRGQIIRMCALFHPRPIAVKQLKSALEAGKGLFRASELDSHLHFLESGDPHDASHPQYICRPAGGELGTYHDEDKIHLTRYGAKLVEGSHDDPDIVM